ncbi:SMP-30/gluconolactonase/LRE family protein [Cohnella sp. GCM10020058]|uniref:SMP-30/gluconolactonase/LRE family protein n=1 Tax=Cohnella sp. GCM10020058 TaxID=3317330 RepID=UPI00364031D3
MGTTSSCIPKKLLRRAALLLLILALAPWSTAEASLPYSTVSSDANGQRILTPDAYVPREVWNGFNDPEDLFVTAADELYVADTGNNRIVQLDADGRVLRTIPTALGDGEDKQNRDPKEKLRHPEGVFVTAEGEIYVADSGSRRIAVFDKDGKYVKEFAAPQSELIPSTFTYIPSKVIIDARGYMYIVTKGGYQGMLQLDPDGRFSGFYGANKVQTDWMTRIKRKYYTEEQLKAEEANLPGAITNMTIDGRGFIYTLNRDLKSGQLKKLNYGGIDLLGGRNFAPWLGPLDRFSMQDAAVDADGIVTVVEAAAGRVYQYDPDGNLLFRFGNAATSTQQMGLFKRATSVAVNSRGQILVADGELNNIQVLDRTSFGSLVHSAVSMYTRGEYEKSRKAWQEILKLDSMYNRAYQGIAKAEYDAGQYEQAMRHFEMANDKTGYSESYWQLRMKVLMREFGRAMTGIVVLLAAWYAFRRIRRRRAESMQPPEAKRRPAGRWGTALRFTGLVLRKPSLVMGEIAERRTIPFMYAVGLVVAGYLVRIAGAWAVSFIFAKQDFIDISLRSEAVSYFVPWTLWVLASYLIGSVMKGEGTFRNVFIVNAYALVPYLVLTLPIKLLSNVLTLQESVLYTSALTGIQIWMLLLFFIGTQAVQNYNLKEAIQMAAVSLFTMGCIWLFGFVLIGLVYQAVDFFVDLGQEVWSRV